MRNSGFLLAAALFSAFANVEDVPAKQDKKGKQMTGKRKKLVPKARKYTVFEVSKQGQNNFSFEDGFTCQALNQKNADRKHAAWLKGKC